MESKNIIAEGSIDDEFIWSHIMSLQKGLIIKMKYNNKVIEALKTTMSAHNIYYRLNILIRDDIMVIKPIKIAKK